MSLRFTLLGLLALEPASGYDLKRTIERSTYFIWNATGPQIYSTLRKLREEGHITSVSLPQKGKPEKQIHTITPLGEAALQELANEPIRASVTRDEVLLRIFFGNFADESVVMRDLEAMPGVECRPQSDRRSVDGPRIADDVNKLRTGKHL